MNAKRGHESGQSMSIEGMRRMVSKREHESGQRRSIEGIGFEKYGHTSQMTGRSSQMTMAEFKHSYPPSCREYHPSRQSGE